MKPCDCKDMSDVHQRLDEQGLLINSCHIRVRPPDVSIAFNCRII